MRAGTTTTSDTYFNELAACKPLMPVEERATAAAMAALRDECERLKTQGDAARLRKTERALADVRKRFARANLRLVVKIAGQYADGHLPFGDLVQEGNIGLLTAVDKFDHTRGVRFCTYATWWIRHRVSRYISNHGRAVAVPNHVAQAAAKLNKHRRRFEALHGRAPSLDELAAMTGIDAEHALCALTTTVQGVSLDAPAGKEERTVGDGLADDGGGSDDELAVEQLRRTIANAIAALQPIEIDIIKRRFDPADGEAMTLRQIGALYSLSRERVRQLQNQALAKLKKRLEGVAITAA
jgi:RNA polymerase primary sigma factor